MKRIYDRLATESLRIGDKTARNGGLGILSMDPIRVTCDEAARWYWQWEGDRPLSISSDVGPVNLPFDKVWIEHAMPNRIHTRPTGGGEWHRGVGLQVGILATNDDQDEMKSFLRRCGETAPDDLEYFSLNAISSVQGGALTIMPERMIVSHLPSGEVVKASVMYANGDQLGDHAPDDTDLILIYATYFPALVAIGMMNCRNVKLREVQPSGHMTRAQKKRGEMRFSYHVIDLPGQRRDSDRTGAGRPGEPNAHHVVRGHFKTYTAERPLMGRHVGTYWWGWQERGDVRAGVSLHDYSVEAAS